MYTISKEFHFSASHQLGDLPEGHQCARLHGHNYVLVVELSSTGLNNVGFVLDYGELGFVKEIVDTFDHRHLNDLVSFNPTSENICKYMFGIIEQELATMPDASFIDSMRVGLSETPKTFAWYGRNLV